MALEVWDGVSWILIGYTDETVSDVYFSTISMQGVLLIATGDYIFIWEETFTPVPIEQGWPANLLEAEGDFVNIVVDPATALNGDYVVHFDLLIQGASLAGIEVVVALLHNGVEFLTRSYVHPASEDSGSQTDLVEQSIEFSRRSIAQFDTPPPPTPDSTSLSGLAHP